MTAASRSTRYGAALCGAALMAASDVSSPASAAWSYRENAAAGSALAFSVDAATNEALGLSCSGGQLKAVVSPAARGAKGLVRVRYEIDGATFSEAWTADGARLVAAGDEARVVLDRIVAAKGAIWVQIGDTAQRSLHSADGLAALVARMPSACARGR